MRNRAHLFFLLLAIQDSAGTKLFEFEKIPGMSLLEFSAASLESEYYKEHLPSEFILCSSHFQKEVNTKSTRTIYVIYEDEDFVTPWLNIGIWSENYLWANIEHNYWYALGQVSDEDFAGWIHICLNINIENYEIETSINGRSFNKTQVRPFQEVPKFKVGNGKISSTRNPDYIEECEDIWTPYLYSQLQGIAINEYSNEKVSINWCDGMPLNRTNFVQVLFDNLKGCYENTNSVAFYEYCAICNSSLKTIYTMRGNCKSSILGPKKTFKKKISFKYFLQFR